MTTSFSSLWEKRVKDKFESTQKSDKEHILWEIVSLLIYQNSKDTTLVEVFKIFDDKNDFVKLISLLNGRKFNSPTKKQLEENLLLAIFYYEKEIEGKTWEEIKENMEFDFSAVKYGIRIKNLNNWMKQKINEIVKDTSLGEDDG